VGSDVRPSESPVIELRDVSKTFGSGKTIVLAVDRLSFAIRAGGFWALMGPSGSGKSTVLHLLAGLTTPSSGAVIVDDLNVGEASADESAELRCRRVGYVLQGSNLLPFLSAEANVGMPLVLDGVPARTVRERVAHALEVVGMTRRAQHTPSELSGGEQQRVALARALVIEPVIVLADEPTGNLDRASGTAVMELIHQINQDTGVTVLIVTHDPLFAAYAQQVLRLVDGRLEQAIDVDEAKAAARAPRGDS
jgi:putative ABC transport system ATP-binding protein